MDPFDGLVPDPTHAYAPRTATGRGKKVLFAVLGLLVAGAVVVIALESSGIEVWPRHPTVWERITYRTFPSKSGTTDVFYNRKVSKDQARAVGDFLEREKYFDTDRPVSVFVTRYGNEYQVAICIDPKVVIDDEVVAYFDGLRAQLCQEVLTDGPVCVSLIDPAVREGLDPQLTARRQIR